MKLNKVLTPSEKAFKKIVVDYYKPYYADADAAHGLPHVLDVMYTALAINKTLKLNLPYKEIIVASVGHDLFSMKHRDTHELEGGKFILNDTTAPFYGDIDVMMVSKAVEEHRASYKGNYSSTLSELISASDRGEPKLRKIIKRIHQCALDTRLNFGSDLDSPKKQTLKNGVNISHGISAMKDGNMDKPFMLTWLHLLEKYSVSGYARYNSLYQKVYGDELSTMWIEIDNIGTNYHLLEKYIKDT